MVEHDAVQHRAGGRVQPKRDVAHPQRSQHPRQGGLDLADALQRLDGRAGILGFAGGQGKGQRVEHQRIRAQAVLLDGDIVDAPGDGQLLGRRARHALLVDGQHQHGGVIGFGQAEHPVGLGAPALQVGGVDQAAPGGGLQGSFHHLRLGGIDRQRRLHAHGQLLDHLAHQLGLIRALGDRHGDVQGVRPAFHLLTRDLQDSVIIFGQQQALELAAALGVAALADQEGRRLLLHIESARGGGQARRAALRTGRVGVAGGG